MHRAARVSPGAGRLYPVGSLTAVFDFIEVTATARAPFTENPFTEAALTGDFEPAGSAAGAAMDGFCDSTNGSQSTRIRFHLPTDRWVMTPASRLP